MIVNPEIFNKNLCKISKTLTITSKSVLDFQQTYKILSIKKIIES